MDGEETDAIAIEGEKMDDIIIKWKLPGSDARFLTIHPQDTAESIQESIAKEMNVYSFRIKLYYSSLHFRKNATAMQSGIRSGSLITVQKEEWLFMFLRIAWIFFTVISCFMLPISLIVIVILSMIIFLR